MYRQPGESRRFYGACRLKRTGGDGEIKMVFLNIILAVAIVSIVIDALRCGGGPGK